MEDLEELRGAVSLPPPEAEFRALCAAAPPLPGAEYLSPEVLASLWQEMLGTFRDEIGRHEGPAQSVQGWLQQRSPAWNLLGRVCFHLAENRKSADTPFAFLATYSTRMSSEGRARHLPLGQALREYATRRAELLRLLQPVQRAAERSAFLRELEGSGRLFHPQAFSADDALRFLRDVPAFEASGILVRVPDFFRGRPPRPVVQVRLDPARPSRLGAEALLSFSPRLVLDGEPLSAEEWAEIQARGQGLMLLKGRWVEIDAAQLQQVLAHWRAAERAAGEGLSFVDSMRLLAGIEGRGGPAPASDAWSEVAPGEWLAAALARLREPGAPGPAVDDEAPAGLRATLRPYQRAGLRWLDTVTALGLGACLADDMGLGKTLQVLALLLLRRQRGQDGPGTCLLVAPASLLRNWEAEAARFAPSLRVRVLHPSACGPQEMGRLGPAPDLDLLLTSYGTLLRTPRLAQERFSLVVLDEAQAIKNPGAKQTRAVKALAAGARLALSGTPIENRLSDLWSLFDFLLPGLLGGAREFAALCKRLQQAEPPDYGPLRALCRPYILRRMKSDPQVIADLPDKTEVPAYCSLSKEQAVLYAEAVRDLAEALQRAEGMRRRGVILAALLRFKQICNHPAQLLGDGEWGAARSGKLARLCELCEEIAARQDKVLVFTQFREITAALAQALRGVFGREGLVLTGETRVKDRQGLVDAFQREDGPPFFVLSLKAGGTGLTLTEASHVIHFDRWWNPAVEDQATDRAYRIGQRRAVLVHKLICRGTVEERIDELIASKAELSAQILGGGPELLLSEMSNEDILRLVSLDLPSATLEA